MLGALLGGYTILFTDKDSTISEGYVWKSKSESVLVLYEIKISGRISVVPSHVRVGDGMYRLSVCDDAPRLLDTTTLTVRCYFFRCSVRVIFKGIVLFFF